MIDQPLIIDSEITEAAPGLLFWLSGCGLQAHAGGAYAGARHVLAPSKAERAGPADLVIDVRPGAPSLMREPGKAAVLRFGPEDMSFGFALAAELLRPAHRPACGEPQSAQLLDFAARVAASDASVLVLGETGTGKEGLARFIHAASPRHAASFTAVNCAALPETMLEAILFGHKKGSFTGAAADGEGLFRAAHGGTLLLDEVAEMPLALQAKLLRALQEKEVLPVGAVRPEAVDVRVIACANRDLAAEVAAGRFRTDLYWRLNVVPLTLPPLRERRQDVRAIAAALLLRHAGATVPFPTADALDRLLDHSWPGNARELDNVIQRALLLRRGERIDAADLLIDPAARPDAPRTLGEAARRTEFGLIRQALDQAEGNRIRAARQLGISERTLRYRLAEMRAVAA